MAGKLRDGEHGRAGAPVEQAWLRRQAGLPIYPVIPYRGHEEEADISGMKYDQVSEEAIAFLVPAFYERVREDPLIGPVFEQAISDWPDHLERLQAFWSSVMLGTGRYKGRPLPAHARHADRIGDPQFRRWLEIWRETTEEYFDPESAAAFQEKAKRIAESLSLGLAFSRDPEAALRAGTALR